MTVDIQRRQHFAARQDAIGARAYITKPYTAQQITDQIQKFQ